MVLFPDSNAHSENLGDVEVADRTGRRSVRERARHTSQILQCPNLHGKKSRTSSFESRSSY